MVYKRMLLLVCLSLSFVLSATADNDMKALSTSNTNTVDVGTDRNGTVTIEISMEVFDTIPILISNKRYYQIIMPEGHSPLEKGNPDLPVISKSFIIPENSFYTVRVIEENFIDLTVPVAPSKGSILRSQSWDDIPYVFSDTYNLNSFYPAETVITGNPYYIRDIQGNNLQICPFKYNPITNTLRVYNHLKIEIAFTGNNRGVSNNDVKVVNNHFYPLIKHKFINSDYYIRNETDLFQHGESLRSLNETAAKMLVVCCDSFATEMRNFIIHKNNLGIPTTMVRMSDIGTTANHLKTYIQNAYNNDNNLTYVLLVGDAPQIPTPLVQNMDYILNPDKYGVFYDYPSSTYGGADPLYSLVSGNDNYPDIVIGRFSANTKAEVKTMVEKVISYENQLTSNWFHYGIGIASADQDNIYPADWEYMRNIRSILLLGHYTNVLEYYEGNQGLLDAPGDPSSTDIINSINTGASLVNYTGHGFINQWDISGFSNSHVLALNNEEKLPFIFSVSCFVGQFNNENIPCFAETWQRAKSTITGNPTGCIGFYGCSLLQRWHEPLYAQMSFNEQLINEDYITIGMLCYSSSCDMMDYYMSGASSQYAQETFNSWILFGDPSLHIIPNNNVGRTIFLEGDIVNDSTYTKDFVDVHNATIKNNTDVIINHQNNTIFNDEFKVEIGSTLLVE